MLHTQVPIRALSAADRDLAMEVCARDPQTNVFVASRILEGSLSSQPGSLLGIGERGALQSLCWASANLVPVECDQAALSMYADRVRRWRRQCCSIFGPADSVLPIWEDLRDDWGRPRAIRRHQPLMSAATPLAAGIHRDREVRPARLSEVDLVVPAAAAMFTEEIGYPPYWGSGAAYRQSVAGLISRGHTFVRIQGGEVVFKADVGSVALGVAQVQGVWVAPALRGQGLAEPAMASVVELVQAEIAPVVTLYVNDYNLPARRTYAAVGFTEVGSFATVLL